eukprot:scaffold21228_cov18-Tisochrysis_lutea.AAC.5
MCLPECSFASLHSADTNCTWHWRSSCALDSMGDAVALILPMTPWAVACYLGIILSGCVVVSIA